MQSEGSIHTVSSSEIESFTKHVNEVLKDDKDIKNRLPITGNQIFDEVQDGIIFWYCCPNPAKS
jgi:hypothetical protein